MKKNESYLTVVSSVLFSLLALILLFYLATASFYAFSSNGDMFDNAFGTTWLKSLKVNFLRTTGRWGQGISNDYRFYEYRFGTVVFLNLLLQLSIVLFLKLITNLKNAIIISTALVFTISLLMHRYYYHAIYLPTANSYTIGFALSLICYYFTFKMIGKDTSKNKNTFFVLSVLIVIITSGLVELVSLSMMYVFGVIFLYQLLFNKRIDFKSLTLLVVSFIGFLVVYFSPGSSRRRSRVVDKSEFVSFSDSFFAFLDRAEIVFDKHINLYSITLFVFSFFIFHLISNKKRSLNLKKTSFFLVAIIVWVATPLIIGFLASNGKEGMAKIYNMTTLHFCFGLITLAYILSVSLKKPSKTNIVLKSLIYLVPLIIYSTSLFKNNILGNFISSINNGELQELYIEEKSRRYYLVSNLNQGINLQIPNYSEKHKQLITYNNFENRRMPISYENVFNNKNQILSFKTSLSPNIYYLSSLLEKHDIDFSYKNDNIGVYFFKEFNSVIIVNFNKNNDFDFTIKAYSKNLNVKRESVIYSGYFEQKLDDMKFYEEKNFVGVDIPNNTFKIELQTSLKDEQIIISDSVKFINKEVEAFEEDRDFSIMN